MVEVLTDRQLTVAYFGRQLLHRDRALPTPHAVAHLTALQAQYSPSPYLALHARLPSFDRGALEAALRAGTVVKATLLRGTLHLVAGDDFPAFAVAWRRQWLADLRARHRDVEVDEAALAAGVRRFAATPRSVAELAAHVAEATDGAVRPEHRTDYARALVPMAHVAPSGHWRAHGKPAMVAWTGELPEEPAATARLVKRYLRAYGPASRHDIAQFTGLRLRQIDPALAELAPLRRFAAADGRELLDLADAPPPPADDTALPVRFLPKWDAALLSHADRTRMLPAELHREVYQAANGTLLATYLVDGLVAGTWSFEERGERATLTCRQLGAAADRAAVEAEGVRLLRFLAPAARDYAVGFESTETWKSAAGVSGRKSQVASRRSKVSPAD